MALLTDEPAGGTNRARDLTANRGAARDEGHEHVLVARSAVARRVAPRSAAPHIPATCRRDRLRESVSEQTHLENRPRRQRRDVPERKLLRCAAPAFRVSARGTYSTAEVER